MYGTMYMYYFVFSLNRAWNEIERTSDPRFSEQNVRINISNLVHIYIRISICSKSPYTLPYRWALKDAIDLVAYSEAPDLLQDIQY